ncbi:unnamed protein product [Pleuronectes platessa]|uniref:Uncharacterized protein n=1 Tax=Pleuronectes platessa TaxID=8262 RepID=A0A9N7Z190_PLEPL|nr:unnamed protein product [Pleuronectes platessa]
MDGEEEQTTTTKEAALDEPIRLNLSVKCWGAAREGSGSFLLISHRELPSLPGRLSETGSDVEPGTQRVGVIYGLSRDDGAASEVMEGGALAGVTPLQPYPSPATTASPTLTPLHFIHFVRPLRSARQGL